VIEALETKVVCELARLAPTTLDYWVRTGLVTPSVRAPSGRRVPRLWSVGDVVAVRAMKALREAGCPLQRVREVKALLERHWEEDLTDYVLYWDGGDILGIDRWGRLRSLLLQPSQQLLLHVVAVPVDHWRDEVAQLAREYPEAVRSAPRGMSSRTRTRRLG
jgi:DNA-binding transcriptional MerR regulator